MWKIKKIFPKIKKKLKSFLADESGKITKKDALGLAAGAMLLSGVEEGAASVSHNSSNYTAPDILWHANASTHWSSPRSESWTNTAYGPWYWRTCSHASWIVNWHYSSTPEVAEEFRESQTWHWSHGSHGSHGSHWQW
jgi:hypothetical protein